MKAFPRNRHMTSTSLLLVALSVFAVIPGVARVFFLRSRVITGDIRLIRKTLFISVWLVVALVGVHVSDSWAAHSAEYLRKGYLSFVSRSWDEAIALYTKAIELNPGNADAYFQRGIAREMANKIGDAIKDYEKTLELSPNHYLAMEYLAKLYEAKGEYAKAVDVYAQALPLVNDPKWKSIIRVWISEAHRKISEAPDAPRRERSVAATRSLFALSA